MAGSSATPSTSSKPAGAFSLQSIKGYVRVCLAIFFAGLGTMLILATFWMPIEIQGIRLAAWIPAYYSRLFMVLFNIKVICPEPERLLKHNGFVFANHLSYMDILMVIHLLPMRFVAKREVLFMPLIGIVAWAIDCVFVKRENKASRKKARAKIGETHHWPPVAIFAEGHTNRGLGLLPFRYGAFEIAVQHEVPYLTCLLVYEPPEIVRWEGDRFPKAFWRLATRRGPVTARLIPLDLVRPKAGDDAIALAEEARSNMLAALEQYAPDQIGEASIEEPVTEVGEVRDIGY